MIDEDTARRVKFLSEKLKALSDEAMEILETGWANWPVEKHDDEFHAILFDLMNSLMYEADILDNRIDEYLKEWQAANPYEDQIK